MEPFYPFLTFILFRKQMALQMSQERCILVRQQKNKKKHTQEC